jgi:hypothetical protein
MTDEQLLRWLSEDFDGRAQLRLGPDPCAESATLRAWHGRA